MARLTDVDVDFLSLVSKGANKQKIQIYKADTSEENIDKESNDSEMDDFFNKIKSFFNKSDESVEVKSFNQRIAEEDLINSMWDANDVLVDVVYDVHYKEGVKNPEETLSKSIDEYAAYLKSKINTSTIEKSIEFIKKEKGSDHMNKEDFEKIFKEVTDPIVKRLDEIEKEIEESEVDSEENEEIEKILKESLSPIVDRLEKIEKHKGVSNQIDTAASEGIEKNESIFKGINI